jgi:hypothetical protein
LRRTLAAVAALSALLALAPSAGAATSVTARAGCYAEGDSIGVDGSGFTPSGKVTISLERDTGEVLDSDEERPQAGPDGSLAGTFGVANETGWFTGQQTRFRMTLRAVDQTRRDAGQPLSSPDVTATTSFVFSRWNVGIASAGGRIAPRRRFRWKAFGYTNAVGKPLYAHWVRGRRRVFTKRLGVLRGPCGDRGGRLARGFPFRPVPAGSYKVSFNTSRTNAAARDTIAHTTARVRRRIP